VKKSGNKSRHIWTTVAAAMVLTGVVMFAYPHIANYLNQQYTDLSIKSFETTVQAMQLPQIASDTDVQKEKTPLDELFKKVEEYNQNLYANGQKDLVDPFSYQVSSFDLSEYGIDDDLFGYIEIPRIDVKLGIYLGASSANMAKGAVHLTQTSLPIGGNNTNVVIAAHRGTRSRGNMFLYINKIEVGDEVYITNAWETLTYSVTSIKIIAPDDIDKVLIQEGRDMVTLISCNPYGQHTQRYVVYCDRDKDD